ncbi:MAG TPA: TadE/TadG family type IV pilus assembly protein [Candidatus Limnocylindria bacterium]
MRSDRGTSTVEFALVIPVLILVLVAGFDFTRALLAYTTISNGSREGVRYAVLHPTADRSAIESEVERRTKPLSASALNVIVQYSNDGGATYTDWPTSGPPASRPPVSLTVRVEVRYSWSAASSITSELLSSMTQSPYLLSTSFMDMRR